MLHQTLPILGQLWQLFEVSQILEFLRYLLEGYADVLVGFDIDKIDFDRTMTGLSHFG